MGLSDQTPTIQGATDGTEIGNASDGLKVNLRNAAGTETGTFGNPIRTDPTGSTAQPITDNGGSLTVDGAISVNNAAGASAVNIQDGGNSITVDGTLTENQGTPNTVANAWPIKITDATDTALVTANSELKVNDGLRNGGVYGTLTLTTGGTTYEAKVGGSRLTNRKCLTITANDDMYWGYDSSVTTSTGTPLYKNQQIIFSVDPDSTFQVWLVASGSSKTARITESP